MLKYSRLFPNGWEAVNYNGVNVRYQDQWGRWSATANLIAGDESNNNSRYYQYDSQTDQTSFCQ